MVIHGGNAMTKTLMAGVCGVVLLACVPARAVIPVTDELGLPQWVQQTLTAGQQLIQLRNQYNQLTNVYQSVAHLTSVSGIATVLSQPLVRNAMPEAGQVGNLLAGGTSLGALSNTAQAFIQRNQVYRPEGTDAAAQAMNGNAVSLANIQAMAQQSLQSVQQRMSGLDELQSTIDGQPDIQALAAVQARIASESTFIQSQTVQATQLQTLANLQIQAQQHAAQQRARQDADNLYNHTAALP